MTSASAAEQRLARSAMAVPSIRQRIAERDDFLAPALGVSIAIAIFVVVTQFLVATSEISLSTTQQLTMWLVAAGLIVLLWIAYMAVKAQARLAEALETVTAAFEQEVAAVRATADPPSGPGPEPEERQSHERTSDRSGPPTSVPSKNGNAVDGDASAPRKCPRIPVNMADVFPQGCRLVPDSIIETYYYDEKTETCRPCIDGVTGKRLYQCRVVHTDPELKGEPRRTVVTIVADQMPVAPKQAPWGPVEFEGLTATPYATDRGRAAYASLRATGFNQP